MARQSGRLLVTLAAVCCVASCISLHLVQGAPAGESSNHYETLKLERNATLEEVKRAHRELAIFWHPDKNQDPSAKENFIKVQHAYEVLGDAARRSNYDNFGLDNVKEAAAAATRKANTDDTWSPAEPFWEPPTAEPIPSKTTSLNQHNFFSNVFLSDEPWLIQLYSIHDAGCRSFAPVWEQLAAELEGMVSLGRVEVGQEPGLSARLAEKNWATGFAHFPNGLPEVVGFSPVCTHVDCLLRFRGRPTVDELLEFAVETVLRTPKIKEYGLNSVVTKFLAKVPAHKVGVLYLLDELELEAPPLVRYWAAQFWRFTEWGAVRYLEQHHDFWKDQERARRPRSRRLGGAGRKGGARGAPEAAAVAAMDARKAMRACGGSLPWLIERMWWHVDGPPALGFYKDPGTATVVAKGPFTNSSALRDLLLQHSTFELPQLRSISEGDLGCSARGYPRAGRSNLKQTWYCTVAVGLPGNLLNKARTTLREIQQSLQQAALPPGTAGGEEGGEPKESAMWQAWQQKRLTLAWLDGAKQRKACSFHLGWESQYICNPKGDGKEVGVFMTLYQRKARLPGAAAREHANTFVTVFDGNVTNATAVMAWIEDNIQKGDPWNFPDRDAISPELVEEDGIPLAARVKEFVMKRNSQFYERWRRVAVGLATYVRDPQFVPLGVGALAVLLSYLYYSGKLSWAAEAGPPPAPPSAVLPPDGTGPTKDEAAKLPTKQEAQPVNGVVTTGTGQGKPPT